MKKAIKIILGTVVALVAIVIVLVLALPLWIGPVATGVANSVVPGITGTDFKLGRFALNPYSGVLQVGDLDLSNPTNYQEKTAVKLDSFKVDLGMCSLATDVIHVEDVVLDGLYVYASDLLGGNFKKIADHASGGESEKAEAKPVDAEAKQPAEAEVAKPKADEKPGKKICIDHLVLKNIKIKIGMMPALPVPTIELADLGKPKDANDAGGITFEELWATLLEKVMAAAGAMSDGLKALGDLTGEGAKALGGFADEGAKALGNVAGDGAKAATEAAGKATAAVSEGAKALGNVAGDGAKAATEAAGKAVNAVGDGAKKAADALKGLFN